MKFSIITHLIFSAFLPAVIVATSNTAAAKDDASIGRRRQKENDGDDISDMIQHYGGTSSISPPDIDGENRRSWEDAETEEAGSIPEPTVGFGENVTAGLSAKPAEYSTGTPTTDPPSSLQPLSTSGQVPEEPSGGPTTSSVPADPLPAESTQNNNNNNNNNLFVLAIDASHLDINSTMMVHHDDSVGVVSIDFSIYSPNITNIENEFMKLKMGVCKSIDSLVCEPNNPIREEGPEYCAVRVDVLLRDGLVNPSRDKIVLRDNVVTTMALTSTHVKDNKDTIYGEEIVWTTWRMSFTVLQLGSALRTYILETEGPDLSEEEVNVRGLAIIQRTMDVNMERTLQNGILQQDLSNFMKDILLVTSPVGEELVSYKHLVTPAVPLSEELENGEDGTGGVGLMTLFFFAGIAVACPLIVALFYFNLMPEAQHKKTSVVYLDETSETFSGDPPSKPLDMGAVLECYDAALPVQQEKADVKTTTWQHEPRGQQTHGGQQQSVASASVYLSGTDSEGRSDLAAVTDSEDDDGQVEYALQHVDLENQEWGRLADGSKQPTAQSSQYPASILAIKMEDERSTHTATPSAISGITGGSGLEHPDTWSVSSSMLVTWERE